MAERNMCNVAMRDIVVPPGSKSTSRANGLRRNLGYPTSGRRLRVRSRVRRSASGRRGAVADDARAWEVGRGHSSCEAGEQGRAICCGVGGAKGRGQGECAPSKHAPDTVPGSACHTRWPHAYHRVFDDAFGPEVGAVWGKVSCTDLCGGREVTRVPTATLWFLPWVESPTLLVELSHGLWASPVRTASARALMMPSMSSWLFMPHLQSQAMGSLSLWPLSVSRYSVFGGTCW